MNIQGHYAPPFEPVAQEFRALWEDVEVGASLAIYLDGESIVDLWGGFQDADHNRPWRQNTLVNIYSATKGIVALALAKLVDQGVLDYRQPVSDYWPEFGAEQKYDTTVDQLLSHQAGLIDFRPAVTVAELYDWQQMTARLAAQKPRWQPGSAFGYHAITWGYLAGELIRRITGQSPGEYLRQNFSAPLSADVFLGLDDSEIERCATLIGPNRARRPMTPGESPGKGKPESNDPVITPYKDASSKAFRRAEIPGTNGHASAQGLARCYQAMLDGSLVTPATLAQLTSEVTQGEVDCVLGQPIRRARGVILNSASCYFGPSQRAFGHSGAGGAMAYADPEHQVAFAHVMNQLHVDGPARSRRLIDRLYECL